MLIENVVDLDSRREEKQTRAETANKDYIRTQVDAFVDQLLDELVTRGVDRDQAEELISDRLSDIVMALDLRD